MDTYEWRVVSGWEGQPNWSDQIWDNLDAAAAELNEAEKSALKVASYAEEDEEIEVEPFYLERRQVGPWERVEEDGK